MLEDQIKKDYIQAMKDKDKLKSDTLSFLRAQLKNIIIDRRLESLEDAEVISIIKKQIKQRQESIEQYSKGSREDLAEKETKEMLILKSYLPNELSPDALKAMIQESILETGAQSMQDMGKVMKLVLQKASGCADNKIVSQLVKEALA